LRIRRAACARSRAVLGRVALARRGAADGGRRREVIGRAGGARPGAGLVHVAVARRRAADRPGVPRRMLAVIVAAVALVAAARVPVVGAGRARWLLRIRGTARARAGAMLGRVALARRGT